MNRRYIFRLFMLALLAFGQSALGASGQTLPQYLEEVRTRNNAYRGGAEIRDGAYGRQREADLLTSPSLFASAQRVDDSKLAAIPSPTHDKMSVEQYTLGLSQKFSFGLDAKLYYAYDHQRFLGGTLLQQPRDARPVLEMSLPLWAGGFGRSVRAQRDVLQYQAEAEGASADSQNRELLVRAEAAYWQLAASREIVKIQARSVGEAEATYKFNERKSKRNLGEVSDTLQSQAMLENAKLNLKLARDNSLIAEHNFNLLRNAPTSEVPGPLATSDWETAINVKIPSARPGTRADVKAATARARLLNASARIATENLKPSLEAFGSYALNGRSYDGLGNALSSSYSANRPTSAVGLRFSMPLNFSARQEAKNGAENQASGADRQREQLETDQDMQWAILTEQLQTAHSQLKQRQIIERIQAQKLENEQRQLRSGRSTTFQILQFQQDLTNSQLARADLIVQILGLVSQIKLYQAESGNQ